MNCKDKSFKVAVIIVVVLSIIAIGISGATFTKILTITDIPTKKISNWKVKFTDLSNPTLVGSATVITTPSINTNDTTISTYNVKFTNPGDSVTYTFNVVNTGTYDAELTSVTIPDKPTCIGTSDTDTVAKACKHVTYILEYTNAKDDGSKTLINGDILKAGESVSMILKLSYEVYNTVENLPSCDIKLSDLGISLIYSQKQ